jgi:hypothetical protein
MRTKLTTNENGFSVGNVVTVIVVLVILACLSHVITHYKSNTANDSTAATSETATNTTTDPYAILAPATVPSKATECSEPVTIDSNGDPQPVQCSNGDLNVTEWQSLASLEPTVMGLGYGATVQQVQAALCKDTNIGDADSSASLRNPTEESVYQISALYYGWNFSTNPTSVLSNNNC